LRATGAHKLAGSQGYIVDMSASLTSPSSQKLVRKLSSIDGLGPVRQRNLEAAFPTEAELCAATEEELRDVNKINPPMARKLRSVIATYDGRNLVLPPPKWRGLTRAPMWDKRTRKTVPPRKLPTEADAAAWLTAHPDCERYTGQDMQLKGPRFVPDANAMTEQAFLDFCEQQVSAEEFARLEQRSAARTRTRHPSHYPPPGSEHAHPPQAQRARPQGPQPRRRRRRGRRLESGA
jgi:hypothetical protein